MEEEMKGKIKMMERQSKVGENLDEECPAKDVR